MTLLQKTGAELHVHCNRIIPSMPLRRSDYVGVHVLVVCGLNTTINLNDVSSKFQSIVHTRIIESPY